jgi:transposase-like protein
MLDGARRHCCVGRRLRVEHTLTVIVSSLKTSSAPAGYRFPREVIVVAVRWYLRYGLSYRDVEELLAERGINVDHVTVCRWVQTFTAEFIDAARAARHAIGSRWFLDETYVKIAGRWQYLYRAVDQHGQVIDVLVSPRRNAAAARAFFTTALHCGQRRARSPPTRHRSIHASSPTSFPRRYT